MLHFFGQPLHFPWPDATATNGQLLHFFVAKRYIFYLTNTVQAKKDKKASKIGHERITIKNVDNFKNLLTKGEKRGSKTENPKEPNVTAIRLVSPIP